MAFNGTILSKVYDINKYVPTEKDNFFVDTNVWFWLTYSKASGRQSLQVYNQFIAQALSNNATLYHSGLSLAELAHIIEKSEREIHEKVMKKQIFPKDFRHNYIAERKAAIKEIEASWQQVENMAFQVKLDVCEELTTECMNAMSSNTLDGYDLMIHESMKSSGVLNIITDDGDYTSVGGINVYTLNRNVLAAAVTQNKLAN